MVQLSHPYMTTGKTTALTRWTFVGKVMSLLLNMLSRLVITFLPRSKHLLISWLQSPSAVSLEPKKIKFVTVSSVFPTIGEDNHWANVLWRYKVAFGSVSQNTCYIRFKGKKRYLALVAQPKFNRIAMTLKKKYTSCMLLFLLLFYKFARYFIPGFHSDNVKNGIKWAMC